MKITIREITFTAVIMAMNIVLSSSIFSIPVPGGHLYANDIIICMAGIILNPFLAFIAGGVGAFFGDLIFYPTPMFVTLIVRSVQVVVISVFSTFILKKKPIISSLIGVIIGMIIMVGGYTIGRAFFYSTAEYAIMKLPFQIGQAFLGLLALPVCYKFGLKRLFNTYVQKDVYTGDAEDDGKENDKDR